LREKAFRFHAKGTEQIQILSPLCVRSLGGLCLKGIQNPRKGEQIHAKGTEQKTTSSAPSACGSLGGLGVKAIQGPIKAEVSFPVSFPHPLLLSMIKTYF
jgi:hypothetical protein